MFIDLSFEFLYSLVKILNLKFNTFNTFNKQTVDHCNQCKSGSLLSETWLIKKVKFLNLIIWCNFESMLFFRKKSFTDHGLLLFVYQINKSKVYL